MLSALIPTEVKVLGGVVLVVGLASCVLWFGHLRYQSGLAAGEAELAHYKEQVASQRESDAQAALVRYQSLTNTVNALNDMLDTSKEDLAKAQAQLARRYPHAIEKPAALLSGSDGLLSVDGLHYYNDALGLPAGLVASSPGQPDSQADTTGAADSGVSRADLLAHVIDYGRYCQETVAQRDALLALLQQERAGHE